MAKQITEPVEMFEALQKHVFQATHIEPWLEEAEKAALQELSKHRGRIPVNFDKANGFTFAEQSSAEMPYPLPEKPTAKTKTAQNIVWTVKVIRDAIAGGNVGVACVNCLSLGRLILGFGYAPLIEKLMSQTKSATGVRVQKAEQKREGAQAMFAEYQRDTDWSRPKIIKEIASILDVSERQVRTYLAE